MTHSNKQPLLSTHINKPIDFYDRRKIAWLGSDRKIMLSDGVYTSLPYYFLEGDVTKNMQKVVNRAKELRYDALLFGRRFEPQNLYAGSFPTSLFFCAKDALSLFLKLNFENPLLGCLERREYLLDPIKRNEVLDRLKKCSLSSVEGVYIESVPIPPDLLLKPEFRQWTIQELLIEEILLFEEAFADLSVVIIESPLLLNTEFRVRSILAHSLTQGKPWEEFYPASPLVKMSKTKYQPFLRLHNKGMLFMGEGLWTIQNCSTSTEGNYWGDCDLYAQFPADERLTLDWGNLGLEARLLWLKLLAVKGKQLHKVQFEAWSYQLKELELRAEENPRIRHFIADAWYYLYQLMSQPIPQGICQGGFWKGRSLSERPQYDNTPWFNDSRQFREPYS